MQFQFLMSQILHVLFSNNVSKRTFSYLSTRISRTFAFLSTSSREYLLTVAVYDHENTPPSNQHKLKALDEVEIEFAAIAGVNHSIMMIMMTYCMWCFVM